MQLQRYAQRSGRALARVVIGRGADAAVVAQAAHLLHRHDEVLLTPAAQRAIRAASPDTKAAIAVYLQTWRETQQTQNIHKVNKKRTSPS